MKIKLLGFVIALLMFSSCAKLPQTEITAAKDAIQQVVDLGAEQYVPEDFKLLVDSMSAVEAQIVTEDSKIFKTFKSEKIALANIVTIANDVKVKTEGRIVELTNETRTLSDETKQLNELNKSLISKSPKGKDGKMAIAQITMEIENIDSEIVLIDSLISVNLIDANAIAKKIKEQATNINVELNNVIAKTQK